MILFVELCVDLKKGKLAKDGLYQYKNTAQNTNVGTIEVGSGHVGYDIHMLNKVTARPQKIHRTCREQGHRGSGQSRPGAVHARADVIGNQRG